MVKLAHVNKAGGNENRGGHFCVSVNHVCKGGWRDTHILAYMCSGDCRFRAAKWGRLDLRLFMSQHLGKLSRQTIHCFILGDFALGKR